MNKIVEWLKDFWEYNIAWNYRSFTSYIKNRFVRKHYLIKTGLKKGQWYDTDTRMLYGMMNLLVEYIDKEKPFEHINWDYDDLHRSAKKEFLEIRKWWDNYENRCEEIEKSLTDWYEERFDGAKDCMLDRINETPTPESKRLFKIHNEMGNKLNEEETEMLIRLVKIRKCLWT